MHGDELRARRADGSSGFFAARMRVYVGERKRNAVFPAKGNSFFRSCQQTYAHTHTHTAACFFLFLKKKNNAMLLQCWYCCAVDLFQLYTNISMPSMARYLILAVLGDFITPSFFAVYCCFHHTHTFSLHLSLHSFHSTRSASLSDYHHIACNYNKQYESARLTHASVQRPYKPHK